MQSVPRRVLDVRGFSGYRLFFRHMKIKQGLMDFADQTVLLVATGTKEGVLYLAGDGEITKLKIFRQLKPKFSDREGFSQHGGKNGVTGSAREIDRHQMDMDFVREAVKQVKAAVSGKGVTQIIILTPAELKNELPDALPTNLRNKVKAVIIGNFHEEHPFELIKRIEKKLKPVKWF